MTTTQRLKPAEGDPFHLLLRVLFRTEEKVSGRKHHKHLSTFPSLRCITELKNDKGLKSMDRRRVQKELFLPKSMSTNDWIWSLENSPIVILTEGFP